MLAVLKFSIYFPQPNEGGGEARRALGDGGDVDAPMTENDIYSTLSPGELVVVVVLALLAISFLAWLTSLVFKYSRDFSC